MTKRYVTLEFRLEFESSGPQWRESYKRQAQDLVRAINDQRGLGVLIEASLSHGGDRRESLNRFDKGAPVANVRQVFTRCDGCPNPSFCTTQGVCAHVARAVLENNKAVTVVTEESYAPEKKPPPKKMSDAARRAQHKRDSKAIRGKIK